MAIDPSASSSPSPYLKAIDAYRQAMKDFDHKSENRIPKDVIAIEERNHNVDLKDQVVVKNQDANNKVNILRAGGIIDVVTKISSAPKSGFGNFIRKLAKAKIKNIRKAEGYTAKATRGEASMIEVMSAVNEAEVVLQQVTTLRDKFVNAYMEVLRMPL